MARVSRETPGDREAVLARLDASDEVARRLDAFVALLARWSARINLVAPSTLPEVWTRHVEDAAQLLPLAPPAAQRWIDLGSGAGLPGLVVAACAAERRPGIEMTLVESDGRKAAFLRAAAAEMGLDVAVEARRIEALAPRTVDVVSARALSRLPRLLAQAEPFLAPATVALFPKGATWRDELTAARAHWNMRVDAPPSATHPDAVVLRLSEIARVA